MAFASKFFNSLILIQAKCELNLLRTRSILNTMNGLCFIQKSIVRKKTSLNKFADGTLSVNIEFGLRLNKCEFNIKKSNMLSE